MSFDVRMTQHSNQMISVIRSALKIQHVTAIRSGDALINFVLNGSRLAVEHDLLASRKQPLVFPFKEFNWCGMSVGRIFGTLRMGFLLGCAEGRGLRLSLPVLLLLPPGYDKLVFSTMKDLEVTKY